ncbi:hypothetical protein DPMN_127657 [Dreissena polymorpha]|uniref:Uncharacterized protein n=1 Tax=Dreissena polymorpha TaxID=45954 RepID=A0A9D4GZM5_DREPO|nr:hypothetical protein DPMN_127657 [Dreissena polymorpha]
MRYPYLFMMALYDVSSKSACDAASKSVYNDGSSKSTGDAPSKSVYDGFFKSACDVFSKYVFWGSS